MAHTVTYGTASAPFLAIRCLFELAENCLQSHPVAATVIKDCFYVDDMLAGADRYEGLQEICQQVKEVLLSGGFPLAKWTSNHPKLCTDEGEKY